MLSFKSHHVSKGKVKYDIPNPRRRAVQASLVLSTIMRVAYQKQRLAGIPYISAACSGLSAHHFQTYCEYN
jgi:hypothetical protein